MHPFCKINHDYCHISAIPSQYASGVFNKIVQKIQASIPLITLSNFFTS